MASALKVLVMSMMTLPASASPYWVTTATALVYGTARTTMSPAGSRRMSQPWPRRRARQPGLGLGRVAADELDGVAARDRASGYGAGHAPQTDETDAAHDEYSLSLCSNRNFRSQSKRPLTADMGPNAVDGSGTMSRSIRLDRVFSWARPNGMSNSPNAVVGLVVDEVDDLRVEVREERVRIVVLGAGEILWANDCLAA